MFRPNDTQRAILASFRRRYGKARTLELYQAWAREAEELGGVDPLAVIDGAELRRVMLAARDGRGWTRQAARARLRALMEPDPADRSSYRVVAKLRERQRALLSEEIDRLAAAVDARSEVERRRLERVAEKQRRVIERAQRRMADTSAGLEAAA